MRASSMIVPGTFFGAEIEPGTFHSGQTPRSAAPNLTTQPDRTVCGGERLAAAKRDDAKLPAAFR